MCLLLMNALTTGMPYTVRLYNHCFFKSSMKNECSYRSNFKCRHQHRGPTGGLGAATLNGIKCFHLDVGGSGSPLAARESAFTKQTRLFDLVVVVSALLRDLLAEVR